MKILLVCDYGNNRSVTVAWLLKHKGHDVLTAGVKVNSSETLKLLTDWAERVIITEEGQLPMNDLKVQLWDIGEDHYPRPLNKELLGIVRELASDFDEY